MGDRGAVGADEQPALVVEVADCALDNPALSPEPGAMGGLAARDQRPDAAGADESAVLVVVVASVCEQPLGPLPRTPDPPTHARDRIQERDQLRDVVAAGRRRRPGQRQPVRVGQDVMLDARPAAVDRVGAEPGAPFFACT